MSTPTTAKNVAEGGVEAPGRTVQSRTGGRALPGNIGVNETIGSCELVESQGKKISLVQQAATNIFSLLLWSSS